MSLLKNSKRFNSCLVTYTYKGCEKYLNRFKKTILEQTFKDFDVIIFNDKGNLKNFKINHSYKIINNSKSIFKNRVESLKYILKMKYKKIHYLDIDDVMAPDRINKTDKAFSACALTRRLLAAHAPPHVHRMEATTSAPWAGGGADDDGQQQKHPQHHAGAAPAASMVQQSGSSSIDNATALHGFLASCLEDLQECLSGSSKGRRSPPRARPSSAAASTAMSPPKQHTATSERFVGTSEPRSLTMGRANNLIAAMRERLIGSVGSAQRASMEENTRLQREQRERLAAAEAQASECKRECERLTAKLAEQEQAAEAHQRRCARRAPRRTSTRRARGAHRQLREELGARDRLVANAIESCSAYSTRPAGAGMRRRAPSASRRRRVMRSATGAAAGASAVIRFRGAECRDRAERLKGTSACPLGRGLQRWCCGRAAAQPNEGGGGDIEGGKIDEEGKRAAVVATPAPSDVVAAIDHAEVSCFGDAAESAMAALDRSLDDHSAGADGEEALRARTRRASTEEARGAVAAAAATTIAAVGQALRW